MKNFNDQAYQINTSQHPLYASQKAAIERLKNVFIGLMVCIGILMLAILFSSLSHTEITVEFFGFPLRFDMEGDGSLLFFIYWIFMVDIILSPIILVFAFLGGIFETKNEALNEAYRANLWKKYQAELLYTNSHEANIEVEKEISSKPTPEKSQETISIDIPDDTTVFRFCEFEKCTNLTVIVIPKSVTVIATSAFKNCKELKDVFYKGSEEDWKAIKIYENNEPLLNANIHYNYNGQ